MYTKPEDKMPKWAWQGDCTIKDNKPFYFPCLFYLLTYKSAYLFTNILISIHYCLYGIPPPLPPQKSELTFLRKASFDRQVQLWLITFNSLKGMLSRYSSWPVNMENTQMVPFTCLTWSFHPSLCNRSISLLWIWAQGAAMLAVSSPIKRKRWAHDNLWFSSFFFI